MAEISWELMERQVAACQMCDLCLGKGTITAR